MNAPDLLEPGNSRPRELRPTPPNPQRLLSMKALLLKLSISRAKAYELCKLGILRPRKIGSRTLFVEAEVDELIVALPMANSTQASGR